MTAVAEEIEIKEEAPVKEPISDIDIIDPIPSTFTFSDGTEVTIERLATRQFFRLLRIVTVGAGTAVASIDLQDLTSGNEEELTTKFLALVLVAIPEAEDASLDFLKSMCKPVGLKAGPKLSKEDRAFNDELWLSVDKVLFNPEVEDTIGLIELIVRREAPSLSALGKRIRGWIPLAQKTGQFKTDQTPSASSTTSSNGSKTPAD